MNEFLRDAALVMLGAFVGPTVMRIVRIPARMKQLKRETERAWSDHQVWVTRNERALTRELQGVDEEMNARGLFNSGIRGQRRAEVVEQYVDQLEDNSRATIRRIEDAGSFVGWPERAYFRLRMTRLEIPSVEEELIQGAMQLAGQTLEADRSRLRELEG